MFLKELAAIHNPKQVPEALDKHHFPHYDALQSFAHSHKSHHTEAATMAQQMSVPAKVETPAKPATEEMARRTLLKKTHFFGPKEIGYAFEDFENKRLQIPKVPLKCSDKTLEAIEEKGLCLVLCPGTLAGRTLTIQEIMERVPSKSQENNRFGYRHGGSNPFYFNLPMQERWLVIGTRPVSLLSSPDRHYVGNTEHLAAYIKHFPKIPGWCLKNKDGLQFEAAKHKLAARADREDEYVEALHEVVQLPINQRFRPSAMDLVWFATLYKIINRKCLFEDYAVMSNTISKSGLVGTVGHFCCSNPHRQSYETKRIELGLSVFHDTPHPDLRSQTLSPACIFACSLEDFEAALFSEEQAESDY